MKIRKGFVLRSLCKEYIVTAEGSNLIDFNKILSLNSTAAYLWEKVGNDEFDAKTFQQLLLEKYDVDPETALKDSEAIIESFRKAGVIEE